MRGIPQTVLLSLLLTALPAAGSPAAPRPDPPKVTAKAAVLMECLTGQILWARNPHLALPPASTTKIMTVLLALENASLAKAVTVSKAAGEADGSSIWLEAGERRSLEELVYGAMLNSGNDACVAIAEAVAGREASFARLMNARARRLGARDTHFVNASGLPAAGHRSSAYDLALIAREALANPIFAEVVRTKVRNIPWPGKDWDRRLINHNKLLWRYSGADGVKTGYTRESGHCLVASATRGGRRLIAVVLDADRIYDDTSAMLDYGFTRFCLVKPKRGLVRNLPVLGGEKRAVAVRAEGRLAYAVPRGEEGGMVFTVRCPSRVQAPVAKGQKLGTICLYQRGRLRARVPLVAAAPVKPRGLLWALASFVLRFFV
ncbi:MAG: D-alanyl-D-alanine carboxypeptidase family protein [Patescibacteria group bacterium]